VGSKVAASIARTEKGGYEVTKLKDDEAKIILKAAKAIGLTICSVHMERASQGLRITGIDATPNLEDFEKITERNIAAKIIEYIELNAKRRNRKDRVGA
jgi:ribosomal protein S6--L-glutamate ligase